MLRLGHALLLLALAVWFGGGLAVLSATRAIFARAPDRRLAGNLSGAVLLRFEVQRSLAAAGLAAAALLGARGPGLYCGGGAVLLMVAAQPVDRAVRRLRDELGGSTEGLRETDPRRKKFGALHGVSVLLLIGQIILAAAGLASA